MFESIAKFFKKLVKSDEQETKSKDTAKERLHLVLMQDRANVSADFLELMKQEIIDVIKKYIEVDDEAIDVRLTNKVEEDGTNGSPFLYANIPIVKIKNEAKPQEKDKEKSSKENDKEENNNIEKEEAKEEQKEEKQDEEKKSEEQTENESGEKEENIDKDNEEQKEEIEDNKKEDNKE